MKRRLWILALVVALAATAVTLLIEVAKAADEDTSRVRIAHAIPGNIVVDKVYVDGELVYENLAYKDVTTYTVLAAGAHTVQAVIEPFPPISETLILTGGIDATVAGVGLDLMSIEAVVLQDDNHESNAGQLRVVHLSPNTGAMDVFLAAEAAAVVGGLEYKEATDYFGGIGAGVLSVQVRVGDTYKTLTPPTTTLQSNAIHTLFIMGAGESLDLVATVDQRFEGGAYKTFLPLVAKTGAGG